MTTTMQPSPMWVRLCRSAVSDPRPLPVPVQQMLAAHAHPMMMLTLLGRPDVEPDLVVEQLTSPDLRIRQGAARSPALPGDVLEGLLRGEDLQLAAAALTNLAADPERAAATLLRLHRQHRGRLQQLWDSPLSGVFGWCAHDEVLAAATSVLPLERIVYNPSPGRQVGPLTVAAMNARLRSLTPGAASTDQLLTRLSASQYRLDHDLTHRHLAAARDPRLPLAVRLWCCPHTLTGADVVALAGQTQPGSARSGRHILIVREALLASARWSGEHPGDPHAYLLGQILDAVCDHLGTGAVTHSIRKARGQLPPWRMAALHEEDTVVRAQLEAASSAEQLRTLAATWSGLVLARNAPALLEHPAADVGVLLELPVSVAVAQQAHVGAFLNLVLNLEPDAQLFAHRMLGSFEGSARQLLETAAQVSTPPSAQP